MLRQPETPNVLAAVGHAGHAGHALGGSPSAEMGSALVPALTATGVHTAAMLLVMGAIAVLVYRVLGVELLRRAWINLDVLWVGALAIAGLISLGYGIAPIAIPCPAPMTTLGSTTPVKIADAGLRRASQARPVVISAIASNSVPRGPRKRVSSADVWDRTIVATAIGR